MREIQETQVQSLGREDPPEEGIATHSRILAWRILWTEEPGRLQSMTKSQTRLSTHAISTTLTSSSPASCRLRHLRHFSVKTCHWLPCNNVKTLLGGFQSYFHVGCTCHVVASSPPSPVVPHARILALHPPEPSFHYTQEALPPCLSPLSVLCLELCSDVDRSHKGSFTQTETLQEEGPPNFASFPGAQDVTLLGNRVVRILLVTMRSYRCRVGP